MFFRKTHPCVYALRQKKNTFGCFQNYLRHHIFRKTPKFVYEKHKRHFVVFFKDTKNTLFFSVYMRVGQCDTPFIFHGVTSPDYEGRKVGHLPDWLPIPYTQMTKTNFNFSVCLKRNYHSHCPILQILQRNPQLV